MYRLLIAAVSLMALTPHLAQGQTAAPTINLGKTQVISPEDTTQPLSNRLGQNPIAGMRRLNTGTDSRGWEGVGRLELGRRGFCTAAMIAPNLVLTAAHCLWDKATGDKLPHQEIEFRAGWRNGRAAAYRKIRRAVIHPDYAFSPVENLAQVPFDLALLELDGAIRLPSITAYPVGAMPVRGDEVGIVSYARTRAEAPSLQSGCTVLSSMNAVSVMSCDVDFGSSGSPVFSFANGHPEIVSIVSAKAEMGGEKVALGMDMEAALDVLHLEMSRSGLARTTGKLPQIGKGSGGAAIDGVIAGGAKVVRPPSASD